jgi:hypothetical protein
MPFRQGTRTYKIAGLRPSRPAYPVIVIREPDGKRFKFTVSMVLGGLGIMPAKRPESVILEEIKNCYAGLSPENLACDGEAPRSWSNKERARLNRQLRSLFNELGRRVSEEQAFGWAA